MEVFTFLFVETHQPDIEHNLVYRWKSVTVCVCVATTPWLQRTAEKLST